ncbi:MAG: hypothetical protein M3220_11410 [Chloroflexota bacterium]|nr:hypothetical protein [Chloroflexota bacterium]
MTNRRELTQKRIFWFWVPLAAMWLIMSAEQPSLTAIVSRLPEATKNLAAWGLTFSFALIIESPVIMLLTAGTALATHKQSYQRLLHFTHLLAVSLTALHLLLALTPLYPYILREWVGAPVETIEISHIAFLLMTPWTAMIAYRRLWEGVMIRYERPQRVTMVIIVRIVATLLVLLAGLAMGRWPGAYVGAVALSVGVTVGAVAAGLLARPMVAEHLAIFKAEDEYLSWSELLRFYSPLALTTLITMVGQPILSFGLAHAPLPLRSLAIWPVVMALLFIGRSFGIAYQEVVVALLKDAQSYAALRRFGMMLAAVATGTFFLLVLTPGARFWYRYVAGLTPELVQLAILPTAILALVPGLNALISWQRGVLVHDKDTGPISLAVAINMGVLLGIMVLGPLVVALPGAVLAALALTSSMLVEALVLWWHSRSAAAQLVTAQAVAGD